MDNMHDTIGLPALLDEVERDLEELRRKHASDYGVKTITMWWELERERLVTRHSPVTEVRKIRRAYGLRRTLNWFFASWATMLAVNMAIHLMVR